jgi:hypothetical protein
MGETSLTEPEYRTLAMHLALVEKLRENPKRVLAIAKRNIALQRETGDGHSEPYTAAWEKLINGPQDELEAAMVSLSQESRDLRQSSVFAGSLSDDERWDVLEKVYADQHPDATPEVLGRIKQARFDAMRDTPRVWLSPEQLQTGEDRLARARQHGTTR